MKATNDKTENCQAFLTIEMEPAEVEESLESAYHRLVKKAKIPGFRKGKAPRSILERYIDKETILEDALNDMIPHVYEQAIKEQEIEAIAQPQIEIAQTDPVVFKVIVPLKPTVKLGDYHNIKVAPEPVEVSESNVDDVIEQLRHQHATWEPVERTVDFGDLIVLDIESNVEGEPFQNQKGIQFQVLRDQSFPAPGFAEQVVGMKDNEEKEFKLQLSSDYPGEEMAGKEASFKVKTSQIKQEILPELNDDFAGVVSADFQTLSALRERVSADMKLRADERTRLDFEERLIDAVVDLAEIEFPPILVEVEINRTINQHFQRGNQTLEDYLGSMNQTEEEMREGIRPSATKMVTRSLVLGNITEEEKIEVSDAEIDAEIEMMVKDVAEKQDELKKVLNTLQTRESIKQTLRTRKTFQLLKDIAQDSKGTKKTKTKRTKKKEGE
ncbi:trigger factor [Chloroflexota bacterium]